MINDWAKDAGRDQGRGTHTFRDLQVNGEASLGVHGKAADVTPFDCIDFLLADVTPGTVNKAAERASQWGSLVRDRAFPSVVRTASEADRIIRAWKSRVEGDATDAGAVEDILPGPDLRSGLAALLLPMSDERFNVPYMNAFVPFTQIVSHLGFRIELLIGGNEGPQAIVHCGRRHDRYVSGSSSLEGLRKVRCPVESVVNITGAHLAIFARLLADTTVHATDAQPVPPSSSAYPADAENGNAGAIPTAPAPTSKRSSLVNDETVAHTDQNGDHNTPEGNPCARLNASPLERELSLSVHGVFPHVFFQSGCVA